MTQALSVPPYTQKCRHNVPKSVLRAVLGRMQFTLHATCRTPHGASRLVQATSAWLVKTHVHRPGIVRMRGSVVVRPRQARTEYTPPPYRSLVSGGYIPVAPVAYQVILEPGIGQFREFESHRVHTRVISWELFLVHKLACGKRESVS